MVKSRKEYQIMRMKGHRRGHGEQVEGESMKIGLSREDAEWIGVNLIATRLRRIWPTSFVGHTTISFTLGSLLQYLILLSWKNMKQPIISQC